jgi:hypothetical protein
MAGRSVRVYVLLGQVDNLDLFESDDESKDKVGLAPAGGAGPGLQSEPEPSAPHPVEAKPKVDPAPSTSGAALGGKEGVNRRETGGRGRKKGGAAVAAKIRSAKAAQEKHRKSLVGKKRGLGPVKVPAEFEEAAEQLDLYVEAFLRGFEEAYQRLTKPSAP